MKFQPVLRFPGSKYRLGDWIADQLPLHELYIEPFAGSLSVLMAKQRSPVEIVNDLDHRIVNFWRVLRDDGEALAEKIALTPWSREEYRLAREETDDPLEAARRFVVACWQSRGACIDQRSGWRTDTRPFSTRLPVWQRLPERLQAVALRLSGVQVEHLDVLKLIERHNREDVCLYCDTPYRLDTRYGGLYAHEMIDAAHLALLASLTAHPGPVLLSSYADPLYEANLPGWHLMKAPSWDGAHNEKQEWLWLNPKATELAHQMTLSNLWEQPNRPVVSS